MEVRREEYLDYMAFTENRRPLFTTGNPRRTRVQNPADGATGGCVLGLDHRIPNGTPLENYRFYISKSWEIIEGCCK